MRGKFLITLLISTCCVVDTGLASDVAKRVQPPTWSKDVLDAFFDDARDHLVGPRPTGASSEKQPTGASREAIVASAKELKWSQLIDADTLTAEIKRINNQLATSLKKASSFQGGGNLLCRRDFGVLAVLFGVVAEYDGDVRWQRSANTMKGHCLQSSRNCKVASTQAYADAKQTHAMLVELLRGQSPTAKSNAEGGLADRALLMQAMEVALNEGLSSTLANAREFRRRSQLAAEQAQLLAMLAEVIQRDGYEYSDDDEFLAEARLLRSASEELAQAAKDKNYEAARTAAGRVSQSCSRCHEGYRG